MAKENGTWIIRGLKLEDPACLKTPEELACYIRQVGFLPLFANSIPGFSVEEHTASRFWWSGVTEHDPWEWRRILPGPGGTGLRQILRRQGRLYLPGVVPGVCQLPPQRL